MVTLGAIPRLQGTCEMKTRCGTKDLCRLWPSLTLSCAHACMCMHQTLEIGGMALSRSIVIVMPFSCYSSLEAAESPSNSRKGRALLGFGTVPSLSENLLFSPLEGDKMVSSPQAWQSSGQKQKIFLVATLERAEEDVPGQKNGLPRRPPKPLPWPRVADLLPPP